MRSVPGEEGSTDRTTIKEAVDAAPNLVGAATIAVVVLEPVQSASLELSMTTAVAKRSVVSSAVEAEWSTRPIVPGNLSRRACTPARNDDFP